MRVVKSFNWIGRLSANVVRDRERCHGEPEVTAPSGTPEQLATRESWFLTRGMLILNGPFAQTNSIPRSSYTDRSSPVTIARPMAMISATAASIFCSGRCLRG